MWLWYLTNESLLKDLQWNSDGDDNSNNNEDYSNKAKKRTQKKSSLAEPKCAEISKFTY